MIALPVLAVSTAVSFYFALQTHYELEQKYKLVEFAKDALGTRNEIIMMNPEYWKTHYDLTLTHAQHMAEGDSQLLASMYSMLSAVADTADIDTSLRIKTAELLGTDSEQGTLLIIEQCAYRGIQSIELRIKSINEMIRSIKNPSSTFQATSRIALARLELHSSDPSVRKKGRVHTDEALSIIHDELQDDFQLKYKAIKRLAWSFIFQETETLCCKEILKLVNNDFLEQCTQVFGAHHPNTLASLNLVGLAHEKLGDYDAAIEVLEPAAATARESYGIGHNLTWRYLNNLAVALTYKSKEEDLDPDESETLQLSATLLWIECIRQAIMHEDEGGIRWYGDTFRSMLPEVAPSKEELDKWRKIVQYGTFSDFSDN